MNKKPKYLIFDLDNTLIPSDSLYNLCLAGVGLDQHSEKYISARDAVKKRLGPRAPGGRNRLLYFKAVLEESEKFSSVELLKMMNAYEELLKKHIADSVKALGLHGLLDHLLAEGYRLGLITNENLRTQMIKISSVDPQGKYFPFVQTSEEAGAEKPKPEIFNQFFTRSQFVVGESVYIGDSVEDDVTGAAQVGLRSILVTDSKPVRPIQNPLYLGSINSVFELKDFLKSLI